MNSFLALAWVTIVEQLRNRLYLIILFFGGVILGASILVGSLAPGHSVRVIFDLGLVSLELFGLVTAVFGAVSLVIQEVESKTIYLILTRPLKRWIYILAKFSGLVVAVFLTMVAMAVFHVLIMVSNPFWFKSFTEGWSFWMIYPLLVGMSIWKMIVTASVALFFSIFATSSASALVFTGCFWVTGHFAPEMYFMINKTSQGWMRLVLKTLGWLLPNFQYFNLRDTSMTQTLPQLSFFLWAFLYGLSYTGFFLALSSALFSRKEF